MLKSFYILLLLVLPLCLWAQLPSLTTRELTGVWTGFIITDQEVPYEVAITESNGKLSGYSYTRFTVNGIQRIAVKEITVSREQGNIIIIDKDLLFDNFTNKAARELQQTNTLVFSEEDGMKTLAGKFKTKKTRLFRELTGNIHLQKLPDVQQASLALKLEEMKLWSALSFLQPEKEEPVLVTPANTASVVPVSSAGRAPIATITTAPAHNPTATDMAVLQPVVPVTATVPTANKPIPATTGTESAKANPTPSKTIAAPDPALAKNTATTDAAKKAPVVAKVTPTATRTNPPAGKVTPTTIATANPVIVKTNPAVAKTNPATVKTIPAAKPAVVPATTAKTTVTLKPALPPVVRPPAPVAVTAEYAASLAKREIETLQTVYFKTDSLLLTLYDNGEVDGDSVSLILNGKMVLSKQGLSTRAVNKTIYLTPEMGDSLQLIMYAENLGSLPPNTGLLIVRDGNDRYEIRFAGNMEKNAAIYLRRRKVPD